MEAVRRISKRPIKVYAWMPAQAAFLIDPYAPGKWGGQGDLYAKVEEEVTKSGKSAEEVVYEV